MLLYTIVFDSGKTLIVPETQVNTALDKLMIQHGNIMSINEYQVSKGAQPNTAEFNVPADRVKQVATPATQNITVTEYIQCKANGYTYFRTQPSLQGREHKAKRDSLKSILGGEHDVHFTPDVVTADGQLPKSGQWCVHGEISKIGILAHLNK